MVKNPSANAGDTRDLGSIPGSGRVRGVRSGNHSGILAGKFHGRGSLAGYSLWGRKELDTIEQLSTYILLYINMVHLLQLTNQC